MRRRISGAVCGVAAAFVLLLVVGVVVAPAGAHARPDPSSATIGTDETAGAVDVNGTADAAKLAGRHGSAVVRGLQGTSVDGGESIEVTDLQVDAPRYRKVPTDYEIVDGYRKAPSEYLTVAVVPLDGTYRVNATVTNVGDVRETTEIEYVFDGTVAQNRSVTLAGGASTVVRFEIAPDGAPGRYDHGVRGAGSNLTAKIRLNVPPTAAFSASTNASNSVTFDASGSEDRDGNIVTYEWDLDGDGEYDDATGLETEAASTPAGEVTVGLRVIDDTGGTNTTEMTLAIPSTPTPGPAETVEPTGTPSTRSGEATGGARADANGESTDAPGLPGFGAWPALLAVLVFVPFVHWIRRDGDR